MKYLFMNSDDDSYINKRISRRVINYLDSNEENIESFVYKGTTYVVDKKTLKNKCCFSGCLSCVSVHGDDCCLGVPYAIDDEHVNKISEIFDDLSAKYFSKEKMDFIKKYGWLSLFGDAQESYTLFDDSEIPKTLRNDGKYCVFHLMLDGGISCCGIHRFCLENNLNVYDYKPIQCFLYPLDFIELDDGSIFVFGFDESVYGFSRWTDDFDNYSCVNNSCSVKDDKFRKKCFSKYLEYYVEQKPLIIKIFSKEFYEKLKHVIEGK